jgi:hydroxyacylglutathione hydrolase
MNLEDHVGDIIRKARQAANLSKDEIARAGGITVSQLEELEDAGRTSATPDFAALAPRIALDGTKLKRIADGWLPDRIDLSSWREIRQITTRQRLEVNCWLVWDEVTREAALFDTGWDARPIITLVQKNQLQVKHLFITHTHEDHIAALAPLRDYFPKIRLHSNAKGAPPEHRNRPNDFIHLGSLRITNRETPGHAEDGVTYVIGNFPEDAPNVAIVGDCIFAGSIGRGFVSTELLKQKIREQIFTLPGATLICAGHGPVTTVALEKENNPFF